MNVRGWRRFGLAGSSSAEMHALSMLPRQWESTRGRIGLGRLTHTEGKLSILQRVCETTDSELQESLKHTPPPTMSERNAQVHDIPTADCDFWISPRGLVEHTLSYAYDC